MQGQGEGQGGEGKEAGEEGKGQRPAKRACARMHAMPCLPMPIQENVF